MPKAVRDYLGLKSGSKVKFTLSMDGEAVVSRDEGTPTEIRLTKPKGSAGPDLTTDEIMALLPVKD